MQKQYVSASIAVNVLQENISYFLYVTYIDELVYFAVFGGFFSDIEAIRCQYVPLDCNYRYYVAVNQTNGTTLPIHVEYPPGR